MASHLTEDHLILELSSSHRRQLHHSHNLLYTAIEMSVHPTTTALASMGFLKLMGTGVLVYFTIGLLFFLFISSWFFFFWVGGLLVCALLREGVNGRGSDRKSIVYCSPGNCFYTYKPSAITISFLCHVFFPSFNQTISLSCSLRFVLTGRD